MSKRTAANQLTKDNAGHSGSDSDSDAQKEREKAPEEVIATRRIISVKRATAIKPRPSEAVPLEEAKSPQNAGGLFGGLSGLASKPTVAVEEKSPKQSLFSGLAGLASAETKSPKGAAPGGLFSSLFSNPTGQDNLFSSSKFSFAVPAADSGTTNLFGLPAGEAGTSFPSFGGGESKQGTPEESGSEDEAEPEAPAAAGALSDELEGEEQIYQNDCKLYKLTKEEADSASSSMKWLEKGIGFVRLLKNSDSGNIRLVVRMKGVYRLILNVGLVPGLTKAERIGGKSVKFNGIDEEGQLGFYRVNLITEDQQAAFFALLPEELLA